jgi:pseudaminic acid synthase
MKSFEIERKKIGGSNPCFIIAELSANHGGNIETAIDAVKKIKDTGADAIKVQTFRAEGTTIDCDTEFFRIKSGTQWDGKNLFQLYQEAEMPWEWQPKLKKVAEDLGLIFFSTATSKESADFMESMDCPAYKIASFEITDHELIRYVAKKGKPIIFSKGIATLSELEDAVNICREEGNEQIAVLQCTSSYPAPLEEANLTMIPNIAETFDVVSGLSDHTLGIVSPIVAVSLGAKVIEKHFIADKSILSVDSSFSLDVNEFSEMVSAIRDAEKTMGRIDYRLSEKTIKNRAFARSLFVVKDIMEGETFAEHNVRAIRPGDGLHPKDYQTILGKKARTKIKRGTPLSWNLIE